MYSNFQVISSYDSVQPAKVAQYKYLWLQLSKLTQDVGQSMGLTYGGLIIFCFLAETLMGYGFLSNIANNLTAFNVVLGISMLYFTLIAHFMCSFAHWTTEQVSTCSIDTKNCLYLYIHTYIIISSFM